jgi:hypothetical protein
VAGIGVEEHQGVLVNPDADAAAGEDLGGRHDVVAEGDVAGGVDCAVDLDRAGGAAVGCQGQG